MTIETNTALAMPSHLISMQTAGSLFHIEVGMFNVDKKNKQEARRVAEANNLKSTKLVIVTEKVIDHPLFDAVRSARDRLYAIKINRGYEFMGKFYWVPSVSYEAAITDYRAYRAEFYARVDDLCQHYQSVISDMAFQRTDLFRREDYLTVDQFRAKFFVHLHEAEVPSGDFRVRLANDLAADMRNNFQQQVDRMFTGMKKAMASQVLELCDKLVKATSDRQTVRNKTLPDGTVQTVTGVARGKVYDSTVQSALDFVEVLRQNAFDDPQLSEAANLLGQAMAGVTAETLRNSTVQRETVREATQAILDKFSGAGGLFDA